MTAAETAYHTAMKEYVSKYRAMVNSGDYSLPPVPQLKDFDTELAAYKEHAKEEIAQEAATAGMTVEEYAANGYGPYAAELLDPSITVKDMQEYGYSWDGMLPLKEETALHLYTKENMQIFLLHEDDSESIPCSPEGINAPAYIAELTPGTSLEDIYTRFNIDHPKDFKGHSLSVSDIVVLHQYFCSSNYIKIALYAIIILF